MGMKQKPIRVLQVFARMDRGGAESMIMNLYRHIDRSKVQFDFVVHTTDKCAFDDEIVSLGGVIYRVPRYIGKNHLEYKRAWKKFFTDFPEYKIIHAHVRSTASIFLKIAKKNGLTTIAHSHSTSNGFGFSATAKSVFQRSITVNADYLFAASEEAGRWLFDSKVIKNNNFFILKNAINTEDYIYDRNIRKLKRDELDIDDEVVVGHVGNFKNVKNHDFLVEIYKKYYHINSNSKLVLAGDGELRRKLEKKVREYGLDNNVLFLRTRSDIPQLLQAFDIFIMPSFFEGLPVTLIEAQAAGLPIVAADTITDEVAITDLITYKNLNDAPIEWAEVINCKVLETRENKYNEIVSAGYDVKNTAIDLQKKYLAMIRKSSN